MRASIDQRRVPFRGYTAFAIEHAVRILLRGEIAHGPRMTCGPDHETGGVSIYLDPGGRRLWAGSDLFDAARLFVGCLAMLREGGGDPEIVPAADIQVGDLVCICGTRWPTEVYEVGYRHGSSSPIRLHVASDWPSDLHRYSTQDYVVRRAAT